MRIFCFFLQHLNASLQGCFSPFHTQCCPQVTGVSTGFCHASTKHIHVHPLLKVGQDVFFHYHA